jgi:hypothetical protein
MIGTVVLLLLTIFGDNHEHLNSPGVQLSVSPIRYESLKQCENEKDTVLRAVQRQVNTTNRRLRKYYRVDLVLTAKCVVL